ncbi:SusC/RagA family TonB-linked outer membrane protein [Mucilaginibacter aquaedulcis]|jgi:TonB-linked SusC/RagA family outer membrane protein|uniref:SusC/RagA family TonB-linked outer membrane protein n=1 Tax=Mucilaginibacter aquaedulcis TaxID=1187081 RepID=UPI0025B4C221|nr:TonB-dependent receptor [Mucilaginibacter aquaedulcis]MDN3549378.1 TonB-dependent receptor [Mucilaginibacter aquaedulcis]
MFKSLLLKGRFLGVLLCCLVSSLVVTAQTKYKGKVIGSDDKLPVVGASIRVKGTTTGAVTDVNGDFTLTLKSGDVITISYIGYQTTDITVGSNTTLNVTLRAGSNSLNEVVVTGYGSSRKKDLVGAVAVVDVAALTRQPSASVENQLQGQAAGVTVVASGQPGEAPAVKIRGANTFGNNQPLYVVDGVPTTNVTDINPNDVANMQVLKDASSASIYGARAANGVIIITTKKGNGKTTVSYDAYYGTQVPKGGNVYDLLNPTEMMSLRTLAIQNTARLKNIPVDLSSNLYGPTGNVLPDYINAGGAGPFGIHDGDPAVDPAKYSVNPFYTSGDPSGFYRITRANKSGTDWYHEIFSSAPIQSHNLNMSGSTENATYLFSANYFNQQGTLLGTYNKRYTVRANTSYNIAKHIRVGENISYSVTENPKVNENDEGTAIGMSFREQPIIPVYDIKGNFAGSNTANLGNARNPVAIATRTLNNYGSVNRVFGNMFGEVDFLKYFTIRTQFGGEYYSDYDHNFTFPEYENSENNTVNTYAENSYNGYNYTWTNTLTYHQIIAKHDIKLLVGTEAYKNRYQTLGATNTGYFTFDPNYTTITTGTGTPTAYSTLQKDRISSLIGRLDYTYNDKYLLNATIRRDGSTRFVNDVYGWFPAVSAGWRVSQESFLKGVNWINDLKIRGGYGIMGNQLNVDPANAFTTFGASKVNSYYDIGGTSTATVPGFTQTRIGNPGAKWESDKNFNIGFDGSFFNQKLEISADYYKKIITGLLFNPNLAGTYGAATAPYSNIGAMDNTGLDITVGTHHNLSHDLKMNATLTFTTYHNVIKKVTAGQPYFDVNSGRFNGSSIIRNQVGGPVGAFFGYQTAGFWNSQAEIDAANAKAGGTYQNDAAVGRFKYADINGDGKITADDRTKLGNPNPKFTGGLNLDFSYKRWDLNMFWYGSYGNKIWNDTRWWTDFYTNFLGAKSKTALYDSWTPTHQNAKAPVQEIDGSFSTSTVPNSYYVENGSFLRLRNTQIGYTFDPQILKSIGIDKLKIYLSGANLITITKYSGVDPEIVGGAQNSNTASTTNFGVDRGNYSPVRTYLLGVQVKF